MPIGLIIHSVNHVLTLVSNVSKRGVTQGDLGIIRDVRL
jgi:hypothetical protein